MARCLEMTEVAVILSAVTAEVSPMMTLVTGFAVKRVGRDEGRINIVIVPAKRQVSLSQGRTVGRNQKRFGRWRRRWLGEKRINWLLSDRTSRELWCSERERGDGLCEGELPGVTIEVVEEFSHP